MLPLAVAPLAFVALAACKEIADLPKPLAITLAICFLLCLVVFGVVQRYIQLSLIGYTTRLLLVWALVSAVLLVSVHELDRGGWIWYCLSGYNRTPAEHRPGDVRLSPAEFVERYPAFRLDPQDKSRIVLPQGEHAFPQTIVVPEHTCLTIEPGTLVRMRAGCSLISYSPIVAIGTQEAPIVFAAQHRWLKWGVIGVVDSEPARFEHVHLAHARQAALNGIDFPGGLSLIGTDVEIENCQFEDMFGKDAIYVRDARVSMHGNRIQRAFKDGVDLDGSRGEIRNNLFVDCDDEGIDLSGNVDVDVRRNTIRDRRGGRIAADHDLAQIRSANTLEYSAHD